MAKKIRVLTKVESHLIVLAANQRDATVEAANAAFNHAIKPVLDGVKVAHGTTPVLTPTEDGLVQIEFEEAEDAAIVPLPPRARVRNAR